MNVLCKVIYSQVLGIRVLVSLGKTILPVTNRKAKVEKKSVEEKKKTAV